MNMPNILVQHCKLYFKDCCY